MRKARVLISRTYQPIEINTGACYTCNCAGLIVKATVERVFTYQKGYGDVRTYFCAEHSQSSQRADDEAGRKYTVKSVL